MDYFKNAWLKRKAERDADTAKNEAAQALTALSAAFGAKQPPPPAPAPAVEDPEVEILGPDPGLRPTIKHTQEYKLWNKVIFLRFFPLREKHNHLIAFQLFMSPYREVIWRFYGDYYKVICNQPIIIVSLNISVK